MSAMLRPDGRPFVTDNRNRVPRYVVEEDHEERVVVLNQFTGVFEVVAESAPYSETDLRVAYFALRKRERDAYFARATADER